MKKKQILIWLGALVVGIVLGLLHVGAIDTAMNFIATIYTRLFRLLAVPTIVVAVVTTLASLGGGKELGRIFRTAITYTLLTTFMAAAVGLGMYLLLSPGNLPASVIAAEKSADLPTASTSYADHILTVVPDNLVRPLLEGNVLALLIICFAVGIAISRMPESRPKEIIVSGLAGVQEILFTLIRWLIAILPLGIMAFAAQLIAEAGAGVMADSLGKYTAVIISGNLLQMFVVLPLFLLLARLNPVRTFSGMIPAVVMAFFTKSSAATLPVTMENAEKRLGVNKKISRFVLPLCTTINMNGCAAFILCTSLYVMQNNGMHNARLAPHLGDFCRGKCRSPYGMLFPDPFAYVGHRCRHKYNGRYTPYIYYYRHGGNIRKCMVGLLRLRYNRQTDAEKISGVRLSDR